jgi:dihydrofolate reductase
MPKLVANNIAVSLDGFMAGPDQSLEHPLGVGGQRLHEWVFETAAGRKMMGQTGGETGVNNDYIELGFENIGANIMGRNMFGPVRGEWPDDEWKGWWGPNPPYHSPVFVFTHHARPSIEMEGGTVFHFTDEPIDVVLERAFEAAGGQDVRLNGGASTIRQYLAAGLLDVLDIAVAPVLLGTGERIFDGLGTLDGYECSKVVTSKDVSHVELVRKGQEV